MIPQMMKERPPYVRFEEREVGVDQEASEAAGRQVPRVIVLAVITPHGSKDEIEKYAEQWLKEIRAKALKGEYPLEWANLFAAQFEEWKKGNELPRSGTPIKTWQMIGVAEVRKRLLTLGYTTVEDLAAVPDAALGQLGLDGRYLRDLARNWLTEADTKGANAKALADANATIARLEGTIGRLTARIESLEAARAASEPPSDAAPEEPAPATPPRRRRAEAATGA